MQCQDKVIAVDDMEKERPQFDARPYSFANPQLKELPLFGEFRGNDNPELIAALNPQPDLIFKTYGEMGYNPVELQEKTGIPVLVMDYGDLTKNRAAFYDSLALMGRVMNKQERATAIKDYIEKTIADLDTKTSHIKSRKTCYIGGIAYKGPLGLQSTEPNYPPFVFLNTPNAALAPQNMELTHMDVSKEKIVEWDPQIIFIDVSTIESGAGASALYELQTDPAYSSLQAVKSGHIYGVLPYNWYTQNHGSTLANAYYIGTILYAEQFTDIDPIKKADEIYTFLVGKAVFKQMNESFNNMAYRKLEL
jgi:iron complex transport system substrate-binding protein